jgi:hypothetical protein
MALAAVVSFVADTKSITVAAKETAPPICAKEKVKRGFRRKKRRNTADIALLIPAMARGCQTTHFMSIPPKLHRKVAKITQAKADERFISSFLW